MGVRYSCLSREGALLLSFLIFGFWLGSPRNSEGPDSTLLLFCACCCACALLYVVRPVLATSLFGHQRCDLAQHPWGTRRRSFTKIGFNKNLAPTTVGKAQRAVAAFWCLWRVFFLFFSPKPSGFTTPPRLVNCFLGAPPPLTAWLACERFY